MIARLAEQMSEPSPKIYLLPNLMTAGNLFCGFTATLKILEGALLQATNADAAGDLFHTAIWFILGACIFDLLDGRLARLGGHESAVWTRVRFAGRYRFVWRRAGADGLSDRLAGISASLAGSSRFVYLACGALRLARFNCVAASNDNGAANQRTKTSPAFRFRRPPGLIASITLFMLWLDEGRASVLGGGNCVLPPLMLFLRS